MSPAWSPSQDVDEQIRAWMEARGWKVTAVNYDFDREVHAWRHEQPAGNSPTLRITRAVLEDYPAFALMEHVARRQSFSTPDPHNARSGFFEEADFPAVLAELPEPLRPAMEFAYWTGWRMQDEVLALTWAQVDFGAGIVRLEPDTTKSGEGRSFPFSALPALATLLERQRKQTSTVEHRLGIIVPTVFHRNGRPILSYLDAWRAACKRAAVVKRDGLVSVVRPQLIGWTPHDFRRTAARNLIRAGVPQHVVMRLCGWKADAMFRRYAIVDERDLRSAVEMLARGTTGAQSKVKRMRGVG